MFRNLIISVVLTFYGIAAIAATLEEDVTTDGKIVVRVELILREDNTTFAQIQGLTDKADDAGFSRIELEGEVVETTLADGNKKVFVSWGKAHYRDNVVTLDVPFVSEFSIPNDYSLKETDTFRAIGDPAELMLAWEELQKEEEVAVVKKKQEEEEKARSASSGSTAAASAQKDPVKTSALTSPTTKDPVVEETAVGCEMLVDYAQEAAIVQTKTLIDGKEEAPCSESTTRYPLTREYKGCVISADISSLKAMEQYTLGYDDPDTGARVAVVACTPDADRFFAIKEVTSGCASVESASGITEQARLVYDLRGDEIQVRGCQDKGSLVAYTETTDGCNVRDDFTTGYTYEQKRKIYIENGKTVEYEGCKDSTDKYAHIEVLTGCGINEDIVKLKAIQQSRITYVDANSTTIQARGCQDSSTEYTISSTITGCSVRHDFSANFSYQQEKLVYTLPDTTVVTARSCEDDTTTSYAHTTTTNTCTPITAADGSTITVQERISIDRGSGAEYISSCIPDSDGAIAISTENCTGASEWTHDLVAKQSYRNKTYYYMKDAVRVDISVCIKSTEVYAHLEDENAAGCAAYVHDDVTRTSQLYGKTYINDGGTFVYLDACHALGTAIPYISNGNAWRVLSTASNVAVTMSGGNADVFTYDISLSLPAGGGWQKIDFTAQGLPLTALCSNSTGYCVGNTTETDIGWQWTVYSDLGECLGFAGTSTWTANSVALDKANSDASPTPSQSWGSSFMTNGCTTYPLQTQAISLWTIHYYTSNCNQFQLTLSCPSFTCAQVTALEQNPSYTRPDATTYTDTSIVNSLYFRTRTCYNPLNNL